MALIEDGGPDTSGPTANITSISALLSTEAGPGTSVYTVAGLGGKNLARNASGNIALIDAGTFPTNDSLDLPRTLLSADVNGISSLISIEQIGTQVEAWAIRADGDFAPAQQLSLEGDDIQGLLGMTAVTLGGETFFVSTTTDAAGPVIWQLDGTSFAQVLQSTPPTDLAPGELSSPAALVIGETAQVLSLSSAGNSVVSFTLSEEGQLTGMQSIDLLEEVELSAPTSLATLDVAGSSYAIVGGSQDEKIAVVALGTDGDMRVTDVIGGDPSTQFAGAAILQTVTLGDRGYIVAGSTEGGLSLLTLLPNGRLLSLSTLDMEAVDAESAFAGLMLTADENGIDIFLVPDNEDAAEDGITRLHLDLGAVGEVIAFGDGAQSAIGTEHNDQIFGGAGNDVLLGGDGDDILIDGEGIDRLTGGDGSDVFVFSLDGVLDTVVDFQLGVDRLDLSSLTQERRVDALEIVSRSNGAEITIGDEVIRVITDDGSSLTAASFDAEDLFDIWHMDAAALVQGPVALAGSKLNDTLTGFGGDDRLMGGGGHDLLIGAGGDDRLDAETLFAEFDALSAQVCRIYWATLGRDPDPVGLHSWIDKLQDGVTGLDVVSGFVNSREFRSVYGDSTDEAFITLLYSNVLGRAPDPGGFETWTERLAGGMAREEAVLRFSESLEFKNSTADDVVAFSWSGLRAAAANDVFRLYQATLGRAPDEAGFLTWTERFADGMTSADAIDRFVSSAEFVSSYGSTSDNEFITLLYNNVLNRTPDPGGLETWLGRLSDGMARTEAVLRFSDSVEFRARSEPLMKEWLRDLGTDDTLDGGSGSNVLVGGVLSDCFVFRASDEGQHSVLDLEAWDTLEFEGFGYSSANEIRAHLTESEGAVLFEDAGVSVVFHDASLSLLDDGMFVF
ncbi:Hemolysin-type calcium-binding repeat-containing protein [Poseidonocella pacifica]|uniref:Hemolysin-type calcium-binding repeat-containing protein n=1 Tax=Poseidonocella pacifica TaxID=871651 RepID=A0A1I0XSV3_9RHOB|nr:DUF4214 domain-containing protein [Poseidonocella pacifica]SFB04229.1 Hemolysin-type calcium-binding repeat-containing protein [Poseidonocella pacifica]